MSDNEYDDEDGDAGEVLGWAEIPVTLKGLRACKRCSLVKGNDQFVQNGCENCDFLQMESDQARVQDCTTTYFSGLISLISPKDSWVAKWQQLGDLRPGMYAIEVVGELPHEVLEFLQEKNVPYLCKPPESAR